MRNENKIERLQELIPSVDFVNKIFDKTNKFLVKMVNITKSITRVYDNPIDLKFTDKID